jgi:iron complex outermembrane receptor protein
MVKIKAVILFLLVSLSAYSQSLSDTLQLREVTVSGTYTAPKIAPFSFSNLEKADISLKAQSSEPAVLLSSTPSVTFYSDNGTGLGYIYYRLRGIDQTRINVTLNGVPMNEPEDQGIYFNNYPDFLSSVGNVQIIRGAGLSKSGVSSYGGSINFESLQFSDNFSGNAAVTYGSFNTMQLSGGINTKNFFVRASSLQTDGYKYNSANKSSSVFYGGKLGKFKLYGFVGNQKNQMAWLGEDTANTNKDPRYNSQGPDETDKFTYVHNQLNYINGNFYVTAFHTHLSGWYDTDNKHFGYPGSISRLALQSNWLGGSVNYRWLTDYSKFNFGVSGYTYNRDHVGSTSGVQDYTNEGFKKELAPYAKAEINFKGFVIFGDVQYRHNEFTYKGSSQMFPQTYNFLNWSGGATLRLTKKTVVYYGVGKTFREPTRTDLFGGWDNLDPAYFSQIKPESVVDNEIGFKYFDPWTVFKANFYYMDFSNEIVLNGKIGPNAILIHQNVEQSYRTGLEVDYRYKWFNGFEVKTNANVSLNRIKDQGVTFSPVLTPGVILNLDGVYNVKKMTYIGVNLRHNSLSYIDLSNSTTLPRFSTLSAYAGLKYKGLEIQVNANNLLNSLVLTNGVIGFDGLPKYFVMAGRNGMLTLRYGF